MYMPFGGVTGLTSSGRFSNASVDSVGLTMRTLFDAAVGLEKPPVIFSKVRGKAYTVETIQVDNVPDVIRSRRFNESTYKSVVP